MTRPPSMPPRPSSAPSPASTRSPSDGRLPAMGLRIGVHSGAVLAGSMGGSERLAYAVIGDAVNGTARLESLDKERQTNICLVMVSSSLLDLLLEGLPLEWLDWGRST